MSNEIQLISDGDGLAVIGDPAAVDRFLSEEGLASKELGLQRLGPALGTGAAVMHAASGIAASSGRWVKMTKESAEQAKKYGLMRNSKTGLDMGVVQARGPAGIKGIVQFEKGAGAFLTNPALLAGAAGIMAQLAMQQAMAEIADYLAVIDEKVDDVLRAQKDAVLAASHVSTSVHGFHESLGIESGPQSSEAKRWVDAAAEARDEAREAGARGLDAAERLGKETLVRARLVQGKLSSGIAGRVLRRHGDEEEHAEEG